MDGSDRIELTTTVEDQILRLRFLDYSVNLIAKSLGISSSRVKSVIETDAASRRADREVLRERMRAELEWLARPLKLKYQKDADAGRPCRDDAVAILKIAESKKRLDTLDQPTKLEVSHKIEDISDEDLEAELRRHGVTVKQLPAAVKRESLPADAVSDAEYDVVRSPAPGREPTPNTQSRTVKGEDDTAVPF